MCTKTRFGVKLLAIFLVMVVAWPLVGVFAQGDGMGEEIQLPEVDPALVSGDIVIAGSSTVFPLTTRMVERFEDDLYSGTITVDSIGSGAGFERFCVEGVTDISNASRPIKDSEIEACRSIGRDPLEFRVGTDALAVTVSQENDFVDNLTLAQLGMIFTGEAQTWADVNPDWPAEDIQLFSPGTDSGTFDYFVEAVLEPKFEDAEDPGEAAAQAILSAEPQLSEDDNVLVQGVIGSPYAIGYFGYAYYQENTDTLRILNIEGVEPDAATVENGSYALARPLFVYSAPSIFEEKPQVADFINYYLTQVQEEVVDVGYFPASEAALNNAKITYLLGQSPLPEVDPALVSGDIVVAGSSTVFPLTTRMAERFEENLYADTITVDSIGSGAGFERFCVEGVTDISNASRPINDSEIEACRSIGREPLEFRVGTDALAVTVSQENDFVSELTVEQLGQIFTCEAQTWADLNADWPAEEIQLFSPGTDSGTFDYFVEAVLEPMFEDDEDPGEAAAAAILACEPQLSEDDNVLVQGVIGSPYAIGYFGFAYYQENTDRLQVLNINGVEATGASVEDGSYPLARPLFIYSAPNIFEQKPQVADFVNYYLTHVQEEVTDVGYFPASESALNLARYRLWLTLDMMGME